MPKMKHELTAAREGALAARTARARAAVAAIPAAGEREHPTRSLAEHAASRVGCPGARVTALRTSDGMWIGVVCLRPDQGWLAAEVRRAGCRVGTSDGSDGRDTAGVL